MKRAVQYCVTAVAVAMLAHQPWATAQQASQQLFSSRNYVAPSTKEQHFEDTLKLSPNQENLPLTLWVKNGADGKVPFNWFRINIAGYLMASEKDLAGKREGTIDVTGRMQPGGGQVIIDAAGEPGATLSYGLLTVPVRITDVEPRTVAKGQKIIISGENFSSNEALDSVLINGQPAEILSAGKRCLTAVMPANAPKGQVQVSVVANGLSSQPVTITVGGAAGPVLMSTNYWMAPPGATLTIKGRGFSANPGANQVFFRNVQAQVQSASPTMLNVIIPNWSYGNSEMNIPVFVVSNGTRSQNYITFDIGPKYLGALPPYPGDSESEATSEASSQATLDASSESITESASQATQHSSSESMTENSTQSYSEAPGPMVYP